MAPVKWMIGVDLDRAAGGARRRPARASAGSLGEAARSERPGLPGRGRKAGEQPYGYGVDTMLILDSAGRERLNLSKQMP